MEQFKALVQYNDFKGTVAADMPDRKSVQKLLEGNGLLGENEHVIGINMSVGESYSIHKDPVYVEFLVIELEAGVKNIPEKINSIGEPVPLRRIRDDMNIADFLALFKRFQVSISNAGDLDNVKYTLE